MGFCWWAGKNIDYTHCHLEGAMVEIVMAVSTSTPYDKIDPIDVGD